MGGNLFGVMGVVMRVAERRSLSFFMADDQTESPHTDPSTGGRDRGSTAQTALHQRCGIVCGHSVGRHRRKRGVGR